MTIAMQTATSAAPLLLTASDGPWAWRSTKYTLLDGGLDQTTTTYSQASIRKLRALGSVMRTQNNGMVTFEFEAAPPLQIELGTTHAEAGVGAELWDASLALALFQRSRAVPLPDAANVVELGAGLGLPSFDLARWSGGGAASVTLTDARAPLLTLAEKNAEQIKSSQPVAAEVSVAHLQWGGEADAPTTGEGAGRRYDVVLGSDICYSEENVPSLAELIERLRAPLTLIIGPAGRPSMRLLRERLFASEKVVVVERKLTLICEKNENADEGAQPAGRAEAAAGEQEATVRSSGVHSLLIVSPAKQHEADDDFGI